MAESAVTTTRDLKAANPGHVFSTTLLLRKITAKTASNGNPFLSIELGDRTGSFTATLFNDHPQFDLLREQAEGCEEEDSAGDHDLLHVRGRVQAWTGPRSTRKLLDGSGTGHHFSFA